MNSDERYKRHLGKALDVSIDGETFKMKPLGATYLPKLFKVIGKMSSLDENSKPEDIAEVFTEENVTNLVDLMVISLKKADPEATENILKEFVSENFWDLFFPFLEVNGISDKKENKLKNKLRELQQTKGVGGNATNQNSGVPTQG